jgi:hypothetical protein
MVLVMRHGWWADAVCVWMMVGRERDDEKAEEKAEEGSTIKLLLLFTRTRPSSIAHTKLLYYAQS